jgi:hypothetical protein
MRNVSGLHRLLCFSFDGVKRPVSRFADNAWQMQQSGDADKERHAPKERDSRGYLALL